MNKDKKNHNVLKGLGIAGLSLLCVGSIAVISYAFVLVTDDEDYVRVYNENDLVNIKYDLNGRYKLMNDIVISKEWSTIGTKEHPFSGVFNGNGCNIKNLVYKPLTFDSGTGGLFASLTGTIKKVNLVFGDNGFSIVQEDIPLVFGTLTGINYGNISQCNILSKSVSISCENSINFGGLVGINYGIIEHSTVDFHLNTESIKNFKSDCIVGGIAGFNSGNGEISICVSYSKLRVYSEEENTTDVLVGGAVGFINGGLLQNVKTSGELTANGRYGGFSVAGGIVGKADGDNVSIDSCYSEFLLDANVNDITYNSFGICGGAIGTYHSNKEVISNVYTNCVIGKNSKLLWGGLLVGRCFCVEPYDYITNSYYSGDVIKASNINVVGTRIVKENVTLELMNWDSKIWSIDDNHNVQINVKVEG